MKFSRRQQAKPDYNNNIRGIQNLLFNLSSLQIDFIDLTDKSMEV